MRKQEKALPTFYSFLMEKVDCGITAKGELSEIGTKLAADKNNASAVPAANFARKAK